MELRLSSGAKTGEIGDSVNRSRNQTALEPGSVIPNQSSYIALVAYCSCNVWDLRRIGRGLALLMREYLGTSSVHRSMAVGVKYDLCPSENVDTISWIDSVHPSIGNDDLLSMSALSITSKKEAEFGDQWSIEMDNMAFSGEDHKYQSQILVVIHDKVFDEFKASRSQVFVMDLAKTLFDDSRVDSGLIDIGVHAEIRRGSYYDQNGEVGTRWHRHLQKTMWQSMTMEERASMCRGVYWGTYLGPRLLSRFSENATADEWFLKTKVREPSLRPFVVDTSCGGRLFALSGTPMTLHERLLAPTSRDDWPTTPMTASDVGARLWIRLRKAGLLA